MKSTKSCSSQWFQNLKLETLKRKNSPTSNFLTWHLLKKIRGRKSSLLMIGTVTKESFSIFSQSSKIKPSANYTRQSKCPFLKPPILSTVSILVRRCPASSLWQENTSSTRDWYWEPRWQMGQKNLNWNFHNAENTQINFLFVVLI